MDRARTLRRSPSWRIGMCACEDLVALDRLHPEERELVAGADPRRRLEFATGRHCARVALCGLGLGSADTRVLREARGAPRWPRGVVGSITHCPGFTGAVAARARGSLAGRGVAGIGIDAEPRERLPTGVLEVVASDGERAALTRLDAVQPGIPWDALLFSAKEATYKAWYPLTGLVLDHDAVRVDLSPSGVFSALARSAGSTGGQVGLRVRGRWALGPRVVVTLGVVD